MHFHQDPVTVAGRICCDSNGKLNAKSVVLEGSVESSAGRHIPLDLNEIKQFSLFPGQIVAMDGINSNGVKFVAKKVYEVSKHFTEQLGIYSLLTQESLCYFCRGTSCVIAHAAHVCDVPCQH